MSIARGEQETVIRRDCDGLWHVWTDVPRDMRYYEQRGARLVSEDAYGKRFEMREDEWDFRPIRKGKPLTDEQKKRNLENLQKGRKRKDVDKAS